MKKMITMKANLLRTDSHFVLIGMCVLFLFFQCRDIFAAQEILKTNKAKVGESAPMTESLQMAVEGGKSIVLVLLSNPMQCNSCDRLVNLIEEKATVSRGDVTYIVKGGQDMLGALDEETVALKKLYGFVTMGEPWTFIIDRGGVLRKIFIGLFTGKELDETLDSLPPYTVSAGTKEFTLTVTEEKIELNGTEFMVWAYNGTFPGPEIRVKEGDKVRVKLMNKSSAKHGLFFHGLHVSPRVALQEQEIFVDPGYEYTYGEFIAKPAGTHLYHCGWNMAEHLGRGMYGAFIVEAADEPKFDKEFVYILSDWNSKSAKGEGHHETGHPRTMLDNDITTINERAVTGDNPIIMDAMSGERIRIRLANIGQLPHTLSFSEGFIITHEDGYPISEPKKEDSLTIYPGKRYDIVINAGQPGKRLFYHAINMPPGARERLSESEGSRTAGDTKESHGHDHEHEHQSPLHDLNQQNMTKSGSGVTIMVLDVKGNLKTKNQNEK